MKSNHFLTIFLFSLITTTSVSAGNFSKVIQGFYAAVDSKDFEKAGTYLADNVKVTIPFSPTPLDKIGYKQIGMSMGMGFPDMMHKVLDVTEGKRTAAFKAVFTGTNTGSLMGNPPTGNKVQAPFQGYLSFNEAGQIIEFNLSFDVADFNAQLMKGIDPNAVADRNIRAMLEATDAGDVEKMISFWASDCTSYFSGKLFGAEELKARILGIKAAFPDIKRHLDEVVVSGNTVTVRGWVTGTNRGLFMGNAPTGNAIKQTWLGVYKLNAEGKIQNGYIEFDAKAMEDQVKGTHGMGMNGTKH